MLGTACLILIQGFAAQRGFCWSTNRRHSGKTACGSNRSPQPAVALPALLALVRVGKPDLFHSSQYRSYTIALTNGRVINGQVVYNGFRESILRVATNPMALHETTEINKNEIESFRESGVSPMPARLLDTLSIQQIAELLNYLQSGAN